MRKRNVKRDTYNTHEYFIKAAQVWEEFLEKSITMSKRNQALDALRDKYLQPNWNR